MISSVAFGHRHFPTFFNSQSFVLFHLLYLLTLKFWLCLQFFSLGGTRNSVHHRNVWDLHYCRGCTNYGHSTVVLWQKWFSTLTLPRYCCFFCFHRHMTWRVHWLLFLLFYELAANSVVVSSYCHFCCRMHLLSFLLPYPLTVISVARSTQPTCPYLTAIIVAYLCNHSYRSDQGK